MVDDSKYYTQEQLDIANEILEKRREENEASKQELENIIKIRDAGLEITQDMEKRIRLGDMEKGGTHETLSLETKLNKQAKLLNSKKSKLAKISLKALEALKDEHETIGMTEESFSRQANLIEQISGGMATSAEIAQELASLGADATDEMRSYLLTNLRVAKTQELLKGSLGEVDGLMGGVGMSAKKFLLSPIAAAVALLAVFNSTQEDIGKQFGAIGVTEFRSELAAASQEFVSVGLSGADAQRTISALSNEFGIGFSDARGMAGEVGKLSVATGLALDDTTKLVGLFTKTQGLTGKQASDLIKQTQALAVANNVAPDAVLKDIAQNTEAFAKFAKDGGENILEAAVQARKLGINISTVAKTAEGLLNFQDSLTKEIEASVLIGRQVNLQKARELALNNDITGLQKEILKQVGSEAEFNEMNAFQRQALADALGMNVSEIQKLVAGEKEALTLSGALAKQSAENIVPEKTLTATAELLNTLKTIGMELAESVGPTIESLAKGLASLAGFLKENNLVFPGFLLYLSYFAARAINSTVATAKQTAAILGLTAAKKADNLATLEHAAITTTDTAAAASNTAAETTNTAAKSGKLAVLGGLITTTFGYATALGGSSLALMKNTGLMIKNTAIAGASIVKNLAAAGAQIVKAVATFFAAAASGSLTTLGFGTPFLVGMATGAIGTMLAQYASAKAVGDLRMGKGPIITTPQGQQFEGSIRDEVLMAPDIEKTLAAGGGGGTTSVFATKNLESKTDKTNEKLDQLYGLMDGVFGGPKPAFAMSIATAVGDGIDSKV